jgi:RHS repeat-associated protein
MSPSPVSGSSIRERHVMKRFLAAVVAVASLLLPLTAGAQIVQYYHVDALGSVRAVTNQAREVIERHDYLPFGEECTTGPCAGNPGAGAGEPRKFTGKERDAETRFDYFGARHYQSKVGRFIAVDPVHTWQQTLVDPQRWNRYAYVMSNPLRYVDDNGKWPVPVHQTWIDRSLSSVPEEDRAILREQQRIADEDQTDAGAFKHAMSSPNLSKSEARRRANQYVRDELDRARRLAKQSKTSGSRSDYVEALRALGNAIHALQDSTSPVHHGFQFWDGRWNPGRGHLLGTPESRAHLAGEFFDPGEGSHLDRITRAAWDYFSTDQPYPDDFFAGGFDSPPRGAENQ